MDLSQLVGPKGLRIAINTGNRALVQQDADGALRGVSPALAAHLAETLGVPWTPVIYDGAGKVFADADADIWDVAFMAIDPARAGAVSFTRPYHGIEATFATRAASAIKEPAQADQPGVTILSSAGSAYQLHLSATVQHADLQIGGTPVESFTAFRDGSGDVVAGIRASLERHLGDVPGIEIMPGTLARVEQAMVLPGADHKLTQALDAFVADAIAGGIVARNVGS